MELLEEKSVVKHIYAKKIYQYKIKEKREC